MAAGAKDDTPAGIAKTSPRQAHRLYASAGDQCAGFFAGWQDARCVGESRDAAAFARRRGSSAAVARVVGPYSFDRLFERRLDAGRGRRHACALRRDSDLGCGRGEAAPVGDAHRRYRCSAFRSRRMRRESPSVARIIRCGFWTRPAARSFQDRQPRKLGAGHGVWRGWQTHCLGGPGPRGEAHRCDLGRVSRKRNLLRGELAAIARHPSKDLVVIGGEERMPYIYMMDRPQEHEDCRRYHAGPQARAAGWRDRRAGVVGRMARTLRWAERRRK